MIPILTSILRNIVALYKLFWFVILCLITLPILGIAKLLFKQSAFFHAIPKIFHTATCFIFQIKIEVMGRPTDGHVIYVGNHLSYIDIPVLGSVLGAHFIAKEEVRSWPIFGWLGALSGSIFVSRNREAVSECIDEIHDMIKIERPLILFPEGTSSQGTSVLPFKSSLFELFMDEKFNKTLQIQPLTITVQRFNDAPMETLDDMDGYAWHGEMTMVPHLWALAKSYGANVRIRFFTPHTASEFSDRKEFAQTCHNDVQFGLEENLPLTLDLG